MLTLEQSTEAQKAFHKEMRDVISKHGPMVPMIEMLGVVAHLVGVLITLQDPETMTEEQAMLVVEHNINKGNADTVFMLDGLTADLSTAQVAGEA